MTERTDDSTRYPYVEDCPHNVCVWLIGLLVTTRPIVTICQNMFAWLSACQYVCLTVPYHQNDRIRQYECGIMAWKMQANAV
jgi:hypothetical protein